MARVRPDGIQFGRAVCHGYAGLRAVLCRRHGSRADPLRSASGAGRTYRPLHFRAGSFSPFSDSFLCLYAEFGFESRPPAWLPLDSEQKLGDVFEQSGLRRPHCTIHDFGFALPSASAWWDIVHNAGYRGMLRAMTAEQESDFKQRHLQDVQALLEAGTTRLDVGVLVAMSEKE